MYSLGRMQRLSPSLSSSLSRYRSSSFFPSIILPSAPFRTSFATSSSAKKKPLNFVCTNCGHTPPKWYGQCPVCKTLESIKEFRASSVSPPSVNTRNISPSAYRKEHEASSSSFSDAGSTPGPLSSSSPPTVATLRKNINLGWLTTYSNDTGTGTNGTTTANHDHLSSLLIPVSLIKDSVKARILFGSNEIDTLFGGGLTKGSVTLVSGPPGVGKSTLLLQLAILLCRGTRRIDNDTNTEMSQPYNEFFQQQQRLTNVSPSPTDSSDTMTTPNLVAYISGEEAAGQLRSRTNRLKVEAPGLLVLNETRIESVLEQLDTTLHMTKESSSSSSSLPPLAAVIIDSIQTMFTDASTSLAGSPAQVRECTARVVSWAKATNVPVILVGHVTKQGDIAGPRVLEHMVDTVMMIEGDESASNVMESNYSTNFAHQTHRIIRSIKNRFGSTNEVAILSMTNEGFVESTTSRMFLSHVPEEDGNSASSSSSPTYIQHRPNGCSVGVTTEGSRALVVELQALITKSSNPYPRIRSMGILNDRVHMLCAVLNAHAQATLRKLSNQRIGMMNDKGHSMPNGTGKGGATISYTNSSSSSSAPSRLPPLNMCEVLVNIVGGLRISDPTTDAAIILAIASSYTSIPIPSASIFIGEVGLGGEIRKCINIDNRIKAAKLAGFRIIYVPKNSLKDPKQSTTQQQPGIKIVEVRNIQEMINIALQQSMEEVRKNQTVSSSSSSSSSTAIDNNDESIDEINNYSLPTNNRPSRGLDSSMDDEEDTQQEKDDGTLGEAPDKVSAALAGYRMNNNQQIMELLNRVRSNRKSSNNDTEMVPDYRPERGSVNMNRDPRRPMGADASDDDGSTGDDDTDSPNSNNRSGSNDYRTSTAPFDRNNVPDRGPAGLDSTEDWDITNQEDDEPQGKR